MADEQDDAQKTEEPTQRRLDEARRKGQVAASREVNHVFMLGAAALLLAALAPAAAEGVGAALMPFVRAPHAIPTDPDHLRHVLAGLLGEVGVALLLPAALLLAAAVAGGLVQNGVVVSAETLKPKLERVSPLAGAKRLFSLRALAEFAKGLLKLAVVGAVGAALLWPAWPALTGAAVGLEAGPLLAYARELAVLLFVGVAAPMALIALLDLAYQRLEHRKRLRMSRRELRDEFKQTEGDPLVKGRLRSLRMERARRRMMAEVPSATVVVTNPTHFAVALRYEAEAMAAPRVVAKGVDALARRIRAVAEAHGVPVVENPPLARALHGAVEIDREVPAAHYRAVAEVIGYVLRARGRGGGSPTGRP
ncbi:MAG TPA: flagellar biosynthesis protein FlhB [Geminicoccaceae bacterium]|nr:flagellar biosynthesis protein FlhB [Geminicoccaceae bacterium]